MSQYFKGQICLSNIPKELIKTVTTKDGRVLKYLDITVSQRREPKEFTLPDGSKKVVTHYISCAPKKDLRVEGVNYFIADLQMVSTEANREPNPFD